MTRIYGAKKDANHKEVVSAIEKMGAFVLDMSTIGGGCPDVAIWCGFSWELVEIKNKKTGYGRRGFNKIQKAWIAQSGARVHTVYTADEAITLVNNIRSGKVPNTDRVKVLVTPGGTLLVVKPEDHFNRAALRASDPNAALEPPQEATGP